MPFSASWDCLFAQSSVPLLPTYYLSASVSVYTISHIKKSSEFFNTVCVLCVSVYVNKERDRDFMRIHFMQNTNWLIIYTSFLTGYDQFSA